MQRTSNYVSLKVIHVASASIILKLAVMLVKLIILLGSKEEPNETAGCIKKKQCSHWVRYDFVIYVCISLIHSLCQRGQLNSKCMVTRPLHVSILFDLVRWLAFVCG